MNRHVEDRARRQHGAITHAQLCDYGIGPATLRSMLRRRQLVVVHRGVYRLAAFEATPWLRAAAAVLATAGSFRAAKNGPHRVAVSHRTAARLWEYITAGEMTGVEVLGGRGWRVVGLHVHRMPLADDDVVILRGVPVTSPARTILDLAGCATPRELEQALAMAERAGRSESAVREQLHELLRRYPHHRGSGVLRRLLAELAASGRRPQLLRSVGEERALTVVRRARLPEPECNVLVLGMEVDFLWPELRLILEIDGLEFHGSSQAFHRDRERDALLAAAGYQVLRFTWRQLTRDTYATVATLAAAIAHRQMLLRVGTGEFGAA